MRASSCSRRRRGASSAERAAIAWTSVVLRGAALGDRGAAVAVAASRRCSSCARRIARPSARPARLSLDLPAKLSLGTDYAAPFAIAPDGRSIVVEAREGAERRLLLREPRPISRCGPLPAPTGARQPFFSPDGAWVGVLHRSQAREDRRRRRADVARSPTSAATRAARRGRPTARSSSRRRRRRASCACPIKAAGSRR